MQDALSDFKSWYFAKPLVTRSYLAGCFIISVVISLGIVSPYSLVYNTIFSLELWRPITAGLFMGKISFGLIFQMYFAYMFLNKTQTELFSKQTYADFLWLVIMLIGSNIVLASIFPIYVYTNSFLMALTYVYCKRRPFEEFTLMFGFKVKSGYFPFIWAGLKVLLMQQSFLPIIIGLALGHAYIFLKDIYVLKSHKDLLATPQFLKNWWYGNNRPRGMNERVNRSGAFSGSGVAIG